MSTMRSRRTHGRSSDSSSTWNVGFGRGLELMKATFWAHAFPPHAHDYYVIEVIESGTDEFRCGSQAWRAVPGDVVVIGPGEVHTGRPGRGAPLCYRSFYPRGDFLAEIAEEVHGVRCEPRFPSPVISDPRLARRIARVHAGLEGPGDALEQESRLLTVLVSLVRRHAEAAAGSIPTAPEPAAVRRARELLHDPDCHSISLGELAAEAGLSAYHLLRVFKRETGLPPHQYHLNLRLERGRQLLRAGCGIAEAATRTGFADQSHFTRGFRRFFGVTPGHYRTARTFKTAGPASRSVGSAAAPATGSSGPRGGA
jgi:AraC-like DNA-binding protein